MDRSGEGLVASALFAHVAALSASLLSSDPPRIPRLTPTWRTLGARDPAASFRFAEQDVESDDSRSVRVDPPDQVSQHGSGPRPLAQGIDAARVDRDHDDLRCRLGGSPPAHPRVEGLQFDAMEERGAKQRQQNPGGQQAQQQGNDSVPFDQGTNCPLTPCLDCGSGVSGKTPT